MTTTSIKRWNGICIFNSQLHRHISDKQSPWFEEDPRLSPWITISSRRYVKLLASPKMLIGHTMWCHLKPGGLQWYQSLLVFCLGQRLLSNHSTQFNSEKIMICPMNRDEPKIITSVKRDQIATTPAATMKMIRSKNMLNLTQSGGKLTAMASDPPPTRRADARLQPKTTLTKPERSTKSVALEFKTPNLWTTAIGEN